MKPLIEAHRGDSANAPENTLAAFDRAIALGVPYIELDVHPAKDGTLMVIHDATVDRTTNGSGAVRDLAVDHLRSLDAGAKFSPTCAEQKIPQLLDVMERVAPTPTRLNIEIKSSPLGTNVPQTLVNLLRQFGKQYEYIVSSFNLQALLDVRAIDAQITLALIGNAPDILTHAEQHHIPWIHAKHTTLTEEIAARARALGKRINVWTVDDPEKFQHWKALGVDKICTNQPTLMLAAAAK